MRPAALRSAGAPGRWPDGSPAGALRTPVIIEEAGRRELLNLKNTVDALPELIKPEVIRTFEKFKILGPVE